MKPFTLIVRLGVTPIQLLLTQLLRNYQPAQTRPEFIRRDIHDASHTPSQLFHCYIFRVIRMWQVRGIVIDVTIIELLGVNAAHQSSPVSFL